MASLLTRTRKWARGWRMVIPIYDAHACPTCRALVSGDKDRQWHSEKHRRDAVYLEMMHQAVSTIAAHAGLKVEFATEEEMGEGYEYVSLRGGYDDQEEDYDS